MRNCLSACVTFRYTKRSSVVSYIYIYIFFRTRLGALSFLPSTTHNARQKWHYFLESFDIARFLVFHSHCWHDSFYITHRSFVLMQSFAFYDPCVLLCSWYARYSRFHKKKKKRGYLWYSLREIWKILFTRYSVLISNANETILFYQCEISCK